MPFRPGVTKAKRYGASNSAMLIYIRKDGRITLPKPLREKLRLAPQSWAMLTQRIDEIAIAPLGGGEKITLEEFFHSSGP